MAQVFRDNSNSVTATLENSKDETPTEGATVTATVRDESGTIVVGANALPMTEVSAGVYCVELPPTLSLPDRTYFMTIEGTDISGEVLLTKVTLKVSDRRSC